MVLHDFEVYKDGSTYCAFSNGITTKTDYYSTTSLNDLLNTHVFPSTSVPNGCCIGLAPQKMTCDGPILPPVTSSAPLDKNYVLEGVPTKDRDHAGTILINTTAFPNNRYFIENPAAPGSGKAVGFKATGFYFWNLNAPGLSTGTDLNIGGIKYQSDTALNYTLHLDDIMGLRLWRGIHIIGTVYHPRIGELNMHDYANIAVQGDTDYIFEFRDRDQVGGTDHLDRPADCHIEKLISSHEAGDSGGGGFYQKALHFEGKYSNIQNITVHGTKYMYAPIHFAKAFSNVVGNIYTTDFTAVDAGTKGVIVFDNVVEDTSSTVQCLHNVVHNAKLALTPSLMTKAIVYLNGALNNTVYLQPFGTTQITIDDTNAGIDNVIYVDSGHNASTYTQLPIVQTSNKVRIVDRRNKSNTKGTGTITKLQAFVTINHGLLAAPTKIKITNTSSAGGARTIYVINKTSTQFTVISNMPLTDDLTFDWEAQVSE